MGKVTIKKSTIKNVSIGVLILIAGFFIFKGNGSSDALNSQTTQGEPELLEITTILQGFQYNPDTINVKEGSTVSLTIDNRDNVNHMGLPQFGIVRGIPPLSQVTVEFQAVETPTNGQAVPTCSQEHGETLTFNVF